MNYEILGRINTIIIMQVMATIFLGNNTMFLLHRHMVIIQVLITNIPIIRIRKLISKHPILIGKFH